jgi:hypothetical protein
LKCRGVENAKRVRIFEVLQDQSAVCMLPLQGNVEKVEVGREDDILS